MNEMRTIKSIAICLLSITCMQPLAQDKVALSEDSINNLKVIFAKPSQAQQNIDQVAAQWRLDLNEFLMASDDDFAQIMSLASTLSGIQQSKMMAKLHDNKEQISALEQINYRPFADVLNQMIAAPDSSVEALNIMTKVCYEEEIAPMCNTNALLDKRMLANSDNLQAFLRPFAVAKQANKPELMSQIVQLMSVTKHSHTPLTLTPAMNDLIDTFLQENPTPDEVLESQINEYKQLTGISDSMKARLQEELPTYMPTLIKTSYHFLTDLPSYKPLMTYCQTTFSAIKNCRKIAEIMIQKSNTMIDKGLGHAILIASFEVEQNQDGIIVAEQLNKKFRQGYECILKLNQTEYYIDDYFDPDYQKIQRQVTDEYEKIIQLADKRYRDLLAQGDTTAVNPETCFVTHPEQST